MAVFDATVFDATVFETDAADEEVQPEPFAGGQTIYTVQPERWG